ncbi:MAG: hypothetical protein J6R22_05345 [Alphaproteobacteria bacterium]|nr:hypothetical protein [Alphaproteobacteria bacterium]
MFDEDINALNVSIRTKLNLQKERDNARKDAAYRKAFNRRGDYSPSQNNLNPVAVQQAVKRLEISESPIKPTASEIESQPADVFFDFANDIKADPRVFSLDLSVGTGKPKKQAEAIDFDTRKQIAKDYILERVEAKPKVTYVAIMKGSNDQEAAKVALQELLDNGQLCRVREKGNYKYYLPKDDINSDDLGDDFGELYDE